MTTYAFSGLGGAGWQFSDANGVPYSGGLLYTYEAGGSTPLTTYQTSTGPSGTTNANPIVLDSAGRCPQIWFDSTKSAKFVLDTSAGSLVWTNDNIPAMLSTSTLALNTSAALVGADDGASGSLYSTVQGFINYLKTSAGSAIVGFLQAGTGAVSRTVQAKLRETSISVKDFGAVGDGVTDDTSAIAAAYAALIASGGGKLFFPEGTYLTTDTLTFADETHGVLIEGVSKDASSIVITNAVATPVFYIGSSTLVTGLITVRDISVGPAQGAGANGVGNIAFEVVNRPGIVFERVGVDINNVAMQFTTSYAPRIEQCYITNCGGAGIYFTDKSSNGAVIRDNTMNSNGLVGSGASISIAGAGDNQDCLIEGNDIEGCYIGVLIQNTVSLAMVNNYIENSTAANFYMSGTNDAMVIEGNWLGASPTSTIQYVTGVRFDKNTIYNTTIAINTGGTALDVALGPNFLAGTGSITPTTSAIMDYYSTTKGIGIPSMTTTQKNAVSAPRPGMLIYDNTLGKLCVYTSGWETITSS